MSETEECKWGNEPACEEYWEEQHALFEPEPKSYTMLEQLGAQLTYFIASGLWAAGAYFIS